MLATTVATTEQNFKAEKLLLVALSWGAYFYKASKRKNKRYKALSDAKYQIVFDIRYKKKVKSNIAILVKL